MEFITLPTPSDHAVPMEELRKLVLSSSPDLKDKSAFWNRKASCLKVGRGPGFRAGGQGWMRMGGAAAAASKDSSLRSSHPAPLLPCCPRPQPPV